MKTLTPAQASTVLEQVKADLLAHRSAARQASPTDAPCALHAE